MCGCIHVSVRLDFVLKLHHVMCYEYYNYVSTCLYGQWSKRTD